MGLEASRKRLTELVEGAPLHLEGFDHRAWPLRQLARYVMERNR
jgi:hypothetical protein